MADSARACPDPSPARRWPREPGVDYGRPPRVLVCDDEPAIVRLIQVNLQRLGHEVHTASDGQDGLDKARRLQPDICILDIWMPLVDGFEVLRGIRRDPETESIYVIMLTTAVSDEERARGLELGADEYMTKPFEPRDVTQMLCQ